MSEILEFKLPDLGEGLTEAEIVRWLVSVGDVVAIDQPVVEVETAKAMVEVPCPYGGVVTARFGEEGEELPVGAPLLTVAVGATEAPAASAAPGKPGAALQADTVGDAPNPPTRARGTCWSATARARRPPAGGGSARRRRSPRPHPGPHPLPHRSPLPYRLPPCPRRVRYR